MHSNSLTIFSVKNKLIIPLLLTALFIGFGMCCIALPVPATAQDLFAEGKLFYEKRAEGAIGLSAKPENINTAIANLEKAYASGANAEETGAYLLKCYNYKGRFACSKSADKKSVFEKGKLLGEVLLKKYPNSALVLYEYVCVLGLWANEIGALKAGWDGAIGKMKSNTEKLIAVDRTYSYCAGERILGLLYLKAPYIPLVLTWPDNEDALFYLEKSVKCGPSDFGNVFYYAEALYSNKQEQKAKEYMKKVVGMTPRAELYLEDMQFKKDAEKILQEWN